jgi:phenylacetate-CoA ligase
MLTPPSVIPGIAWPAIVADDAALLLSIQFQLEASQWWPREQLEACQLVQLDALARHAASQVPFQARRLQQAGYRADRPLTWETFRRIPVSTRTDVQQQGAAMHAARFPPEHGNVRRDATSGSTFEPIDFLATDLVQVWWNAFTLREHLWHRRDFAGSLAAIRSVTSPGDAPTWGSPADIVAATGRGHALRVSTPVPDQIEWLLERDPDYLMSYPSNVLALAREFEVRGQRLARLREVRTYGEVVTPELREVCRRVWGVPVTDVYSAQECGYLAFQCPLHDHYHVQSEAVLLEVLDDTGAPCAPGTVGRVVVTSLSNFVMPFLRYDLGDYAEVGSPCECGRGLPVLTRIMGRVRNMATLPDGSRFWPRIRSGELSRIVPLQQFRLVQTALDAMRLEVVSADPLSQSEARAVADNVRERLGHPFRIEVVRVGRIDRGCGDKFEDFRSELPT